MQAQIALREVAAAAANFAVLCPARTLDADAGSDGTTVRPRPLELEQDPAALRRFLRIQQGRRCILTVDQDFQLPVVIYVCSGQASSGPRCQNAGTGGCRDIPEALAFDVAVEDSGLAVAEVGFRQVVHLGKNVAIDEQDVPPAIVIHVQKYATPAHEARVHAQAERDGRIVKVAVSAIGVEGGSLVGEVGPEDVRRTVPVEVAGGHAHAR